ncbi:T9SS type A sorting domain-containing protein [Viscerimonas tarda]
MKKYKFLLAALLGCLLGVQTIDAQVINAKNDNFFVQPGAVGITSNLNVLANDFYGDACTVENLMVNITTGSATPLGAAVWYDATSHTIGYYASTVSGTDSLEYEIFCSGDPVNKSSAKVYIYVNEKPGAVSDASCFTKPSGITFDIVEVAHSDNSLHVPSSLSETLAGDIDNDGEVELIITTLLSKGISQRAGNIIVYRYNTSTDALDVKYVIPVTGWDTSIAFVDTFIAFAKITGGGVNTTSTASIFFANPAEGKLYRYDLTGTGTSAYTETWSVALREPGDPNVHYLGPQPFITDIMGDGNQQIICGPKVFNADTGALLMEATDASGIPVVSTTTNTVAANNYSFGRFGLPLHSTISNYQLGMIAVDVDEDGLPELIGGDCVYKVTIGDYATNNTALNTYRLWRRANYKDDLATVWDANHTANIGIGDGGTAVIDIDLDGKLEVVVSSKVGGIRFGSYSADACVYVYNPRTGQLLHDNVINNIQLGGWPPSRPFAGDIDGDGYPEFAITAYCTIRAFKLNAATRTLTPRWDLPTTDTSAATTLSMFDFSQDGQARLIYRDETTLRIIQDTISTIGLGPGAKVEYTFNNVTSGTANEYPIVADVDGDDHAEIIVTGGYGAATTSYTNGELRVFAAAGAEKWAPARKLWHQSTYNPVFINDDLTIPTHPISPAAKFIAADGTITRPFNNFLQQSTLLNTEGTMTAEGADLSFKSGAPRKIGYDAGGNLEVKVTIQNIGGVAFTGPINFQMYSFVDGSPAVYTKLNPTPSFTDPNTSGLHPSISRDIAFTVPVASLPVAGAFDGYAITMNLSTDPGDLSPAYSGMIECHEGYNNRALGFNALDGMAILCEGSSATLEVNPAGTYDVQWYLPTPGGNILQNGGAFSDTYNFGPKDNKPVSHMLVQAFYTGSGLPVSPMMDTVYIYRAPDSLVWTNSTLNGDWHDEANWHNPATNHYPIANVPQACTNVLIPAGAGLNFPDLSLTTALPYAPLGVPTADSIYFNFGGEIKRPDLLTYNKAFVKTNLRVHRWYMFAPPLKDFYVGDFYLNDPIPANDLVTSYIKIWGENNSSQGPFANLINTPGWSWLINEPDVTFDPGQGVGIWLSDNNDDFSTAEHQFAFPKKDTQYNVYYKGTTTPNLHFPTYTLPSRADANRFIFDGSGAGGANFNLTAKADAAGDLVMVSNPFMAHLDFDQFYAANSTKIQNYYQILNANGSTYDTYQIGTGGTLTKDIAPMQSFIVVAKGAFSKLSTPLTVNGTMTTRVPGNTLKSAAASAESVSKMVVPVTVTQGNSKSRTFLSFGDNYSATYSDNEDVVALFTSTGSDVQPIGSYSFTGEGKRVNVNALPYEYIKNGGSIPLGFRTPLSEKITINVGNLTSLLVADSKACLHDAATGKDYDLNQQSMYTFDNVTPDENLFIENRFSLKIVKVETGIKPEVTDDDKTIVVTVKDNQLHVKSQEVIDEVYVYNVQGQIIYSAKPNNYSLNATLGDDNLVIVKVYAGNKTVSKKIIK